uniref:Kringle domain-containing protein n=1 Tax=Macrostomum lignano TaxID=282301 RepID=A0A1I8FV82_9PLAT
PTANKMPGYNNDQFYNFSSAKRKCMTVDEHSVEAKRFCIATSASGDAEPLPFGCFQPCQQQQQQQPQNCAFPAWNVCQNNNNNNGHAGELGLAAAPADAPMELHEAEPAAAAALPDYRCTTSIADIGMCAISTASSTAG